MVEGAGRSGSGESPERSHVLLTQAEGRAGQALIPSFRDSALPLSIVVSKARRKPRHAGVPEDVVAADPFATPLAYANAVAAAARARNAAIVVPTSDDLLVLSRHRDLFEPEIPVLAPPFADLVRVVDRARIVEHARAAGVAAPLFIEVRSATVLADAARRLGFPLALRPRFGRGRDSWFVFERDADLAARERELARLFEGARFLAERQVPGEEVEAVGVVRGGRVEALACLLVLRVSMQRGGVVTSRQVIRDVVVETAAGRVLERLGVEGVVTARLRWVRKDGRVWLLDLEPYFGDTLPAVLASGVDIAAIYAHEISGREGRWRDQVPHRAIESRWWAADVAYFFEQLLDGHWRAAAKVFRRGASRRIREGGRGGLGLALGGLRSGGARAVGLPPRARPLSARTRWLEGEAQGQA